MEGSISDPDEGDGFFSILGETRLEAGRHQPYVRVEYAIRPEYAREGAAGSDEFFRYHHDDAPVGATRWLIATAAYAHETTGYPFSLRPFAEVQAHAVAAERGGIDPVALFGSDRFWSITVGARVFLGGDPMRMGAYGILDPMTRVAGGPAPARPATPGHPGHSGH